MTDICGWNIIASVARLSHPTAQICFLIIHEVFIAKTAKRIEQTPVNHEICSLNITYLQRRSSMIEKAVYTPTYFAELVECHVVNALK